MKFFSKELCEKLEKLGCKSESNFVHQEYPTMGAFKLMLDVKAKIFLIGIKVPAFTQNDFIGCHQQARENAKIVWGTKPVDGASSSFVRPVAYYPYYAEDEDWDHAFEMHRHAMIDASDAEEYLLTTMKESLK